MAKKIVIMQVKYISWKGCFDMIATVNDFIINNGMKRA